MSCACTAAESRDTAANAEAIRNFSEYLRIPSVQPDVDYGPCVAFLRVQAEGLGLPISVYHLSPSKPIVVLTWEGQEPTLPSILLNSHMDVVPVFPEMWKHAPFGAERDAEGRIFARGAQDMKCVGIQYLEAIRRLKRRGISLKRTVHVSFVPDEEIGGKEGMKKFVHTSEFVALNVGVALDEGMASETQEYSLFYGERSIWHIHVHCPGSPGHGSLLLDDTAGEKIRRVIDSFMDFREKEKKRLAADPSLELGQVTTVNLTQLKGGVQSNVVPPELTVVFDVRLAPSVDHKEFEAQVKRWCEEAGPGIWFEFEQKCPQVDVTALNENNPWWMAFKRESDAMGLKLKPLIFPAGTDSRYIREVGLPALGFSPMNFTPVLLHDHDEFLQEGVFLRGIEIYESIIPALANVSPPVQ